MGVRSELTKSNQIQGGQLDQDQSFACLRTLRISPAKSLDGEHVIVQEIQEHICLSGKVISRQRTLQHSRWARVAVTLWKARAKSHVGEK